jgi:hypothetical protein
MMVSIEFSLFLCFSVPFVEFLCSSEFVVLEYTYTCTQFHRDAQLPSFWEIRAVNSSIDRTLWKVTIVEILVLLFWNFR